MLIYSYRYTYDNNGRLKTETDPEGHTTTYVYDGVGNLSEEIRPNGSIYFYEYDVLNRIKSKNFKGSQQAESELLEEYFYSTLDDGKTQITHRRYFNDTSYATTVEKYDYADRLVSKINPDSSIEEIEYNKNGTVKERTTPNGTTFYEYDGMNRRISTLVPFENTVSGTLYTYSCTVYDKTGLVVNEIIGKEAVLKDQKPFSFVSTDYDYYKNGQLKLVTDSSGQKTYYEYDKDGNVELEEIYADENNKIKTVYTNNHFGSPDVVTQYIKNGDIYGNSFGDEAEIELVTKYQYDKNGNVESITKPDGSTTTFEYDNMDRREKSIESSINIEGHIYYIENTTEYNWEGNPLAEKDGNNNYTYYTYNKRGDLETTKKSVSVDGKTTNYYTAFEYDRAGRLVIEVSPKNYIEGIPLNSLNRTQYEYDGMDRLLQKSYVGKVTEYNASQNDFTTVDRTVLINKNEYDEKGNLKRETDAIGYEEGYWTEYEYNLQGMNTRVLDPEAKDKGFSYSKKYVYDALGRVREEYTIKGGTQTQPSYETLTKYQYDDAGNILNIKVNKEGEPEKTIQVNTYDYLGNLLTQKDGNNNITTYEYNGFSKLRKVIYPRDETIDSNIVTYQYDVVGNLRRSENSLGRVDLSTYNYQGQELTHTVQESDGSDAINTSAIYDRNGNLTYEIDGRENTVMYQYDQLNRLVKERSTAGNVEHITEYIYDPNGNVEIERQKVKDGDSEAVSEYTNVYDELNRLIQKSDPYNVIENLKYNDASLQTVEQHFNIVLNSKLKYQQNE